MKFLNLIFMLLPVLYSCTASAPADGVCARSCSNRPVGGGRVYGEPLSDPKSISCKSGQELDPVTFRFFVYEDMAQSNESSGSGATDAKFPPRIGKAGVAITPLIDGSNTLLTPTKDLCTDSCGYAEVTFTPKCVDQSVSIGIVSTGMIFDKGGPPKTQLTVTVSDN